MKKITPWLWYAKEAEEAAAFYVSIFPDSRVKRVTAMPTDSPSGPAGSVKIVEFELFGQAFGAMSAGPLDPFNHAISFMVECDDRADIVVRSLSPTVSRTRKREGYLMRRAEAVPRPRSGKRISVRVAHPHCEICNCPRDSIVTPAADRTLGPDDGASPRLR